MSMELLMESISNPVLGKGGIFGSSDIETLFRTGVQGVYLDSLLWTEPEHVLPIIEQSRVTNF